MGLYRATKDTCVIRDIANDRQEDRYYAENRLRLKYHSQNRTTAMRCLIASPVKKTLQNLRAEEELAAEGFESEYKKDRDDGAEWKRME